jgi:hypothetical protein
MGGILSKSVDNGSVIHRFPGYSSGFAAYEATEPKESYLRMSLEDEQPEDPRDSDSLMIEATAFGWSEKRIAEYANVSVRTIRRRKADHGFMGKVRQLRKEMLEQSGAKLVKSLGKAIARLEKLLKCDKENIQLAASRSLIELCIRMRETVDHEERIASIEAKLTAGSKD